MADLLGEVNANVPSRRPAGHMKSVKTENRRKTRVLSPPVERPVSAINKPHLAPKPPMDDDEPYYAPADEDVPMSDALPSSPVAKAVERKVVTTVPIKTEEDEEEDDDMLEVAEVTGQSTAKGASVNLKGSRPAPKIKKPEYPSPDSSSPTRPTPDVVELPAWANVTDKLNLLSSPAPSEAITSGKLSSQDAVEADGSLRMFWTDYTEVNGSLCLFGKVKDKKSGQFVSCFVKVDNILRKVYFLPREYRTKHGRQTDQEVEMGHVYEEVAALMSKLRVDMHKIKPCSRKYAFELPDIPKEADYLKLLYPYNKPALPTDLDGETFSHVFGYNTALFEQFVLWKNIMGPCWLNIDAKGANFNAATNASWCKLELGVDNPSFITTLGESDNLEAPPLTLMSIALRTTMNVKDNKQEILVASARIYENVSLTDTTPADKLPCRTFTVMRPNGQYPIGFNSDVEKHRGSSSVIKMERSEAALLSMFLALLAKADPDVLMGHRLDDVDYSLLLSRMREKKTPGWHRIGRLKRSDWPKNIGKGGGSFFVERQLAAGRLLCDLANDMGKSLMTKCQSWSLDEMVDLILAGDTKRREMEADAALKMASTRVGLMNYVKLVEADTYFISAVAMKVQMLPLTKILTNLAGNSWARTLSGTRAERNEYILLHEFHRNKYICPDKVWSKGKQKSDDDNPEGEDVVSKKKDKYKGGLVFEPEKGLYDKFILVMDFNSLYPSIIQEYNICFTTVERGEIGEEEDKCPEVPGDTANKGILPRLIRTLVQRRREVKKLMKDKSATVEQIATWDIKQTALKLTANSMYGCLGYTKSRFYARPLAMLTTSKGREILQSTKDLAEGEHRLKVIYGDTDSVMVNTNVDNIADAIKIGNEFKKSVNERYELLEIDIDNIFRRLLLHAKKKYAAVNMIEKNGKWVDQLEVKGLDMKRREYCALSKETSTELLNYLLSGEDPETVVQQIHDYLRQVASRMKANEVPLRKYIIYTQLGKDPKDYPNGNSMPSVQVALKMMAKGKSVRAKDVMSYIICGDASGSAEKAAGNAQPVDEVLKPDSEYKPDMDYYLHKQILPPVERLCAPIDGTNVTLLAECLGLDTSKYRVSTASSALNNTETEIYPLESQIPDHIRFKDCEALRLKCLSCGQRFQYRGLTSADAGVEEDGIPNGVVTNNGLACPRSECKSVMANVSLVAQVESQIRAHTAQYYSGWLICDEAMCNLRTRQMSVYGHRCLGPRGLAHGCTGKMTFEYSEKALYNQLLFLQRLFDADKGIEVLAKKPLVGAGEQREKEKVLLEMNRGRWETCRKVVDGYLDKSGWGWVSMDSLFGFALKAVV